MGRDAVTARAAPAQPGQTPGGVLEGGRVQHRGLLDGQHHGLIPTAVQRRRAVAFQNIVHGDPGVGEQPIRGLRLFPTGKDDRHRLAGTRFPVCRHGPDPFPDAAIQRGSPAGRRHRRRRHAASRGRIQTIGPTSAPAYTPDTRPAISQPAAA